jgi:hypothetical protein
MVEGNRNDGGSRRGLGIPVWQENSFLSGIIRVWSLLFIRVMYVSVERWIDGH